MKVWIDCRRIIAVIPKYLGPELKKFDDSSWEGLFPVYMELVERTFQFWYKYLKNCLNSADGLVDIVRLGDGLGGQNGLLFSVEKYKKIFAQKHKQLFDLAHQYGAKVMRYDYCTIQSDPG